MDQQDTAVAAERITREHVLWACGAGLLPIPLADFVAVTAVQLDLIRQLCVLHGVHYEEGTGKMWVGALTGGAVARLGASVIKALPGIGTVLGGVSMSIASGASTWAVGQVVQKHLGAGGGMTDFDVERAKADYAKEYETGKKVAEQSRKSASGDVFEKLKHLGELKEKGVITQAEFDAKKAELLAQV